MKISTKNVFHVMFYFKFQLEIFGSSIHDYQLSQVGIFVLARNQLQQTSQDTKCPPQSLS